MGLEEQAQTATHQLKAGQGRRQCEQDGIGGMSTDNNLHPESSAGFQREGGDVSKIGLEEWPQTATHSLKAGRGRR